MAAPNQTGASSFMGWGGEWGKKLTEGVAEVRKQVQEQVHEAVNEAGEALSKKGEQNGSAKTSDAQALAKRVALLEGVIKKLIPVKDNPTELAELWNKGITAGKQVETLQTDRRKLDGLCRQYEERIEQLTIDVSAKEAQIEQQDVELKTKLETAVINETNRRERTQEADEAKMKQNDEALAARTQEIERVTTLLKQRDAQVRRMEAALEQLQTSQRAISSAALSSIDVHEQVARSIVEDLVSNVTQDKNNTIGSANERSMDEERYRGLQQAEEKALSLEFEIVRLKEKLYIAEESALRAQEDLKKETEEHERAENRRREAVFNQSESLDKERQAKADLESLINRMRESVEKVRTLEQARKDAEETASAALKGETSAKSAQMELESKVKTLTEQLSLQSGLLSEREKQIEDLKRQTAKRLRDLDKEKTAATAHLKSIKEDAESAKDAHLSAEARCQAALEELESLRAVLANRSTNIESLETSVTQEKLRNTDLQNEIVHKERDFARFKEKAKLAVGQRDTALEELKVEINLLKDNETNIQRSNTEREESLAQLKIAENKLKTVESELQSVKQKNQNLEACLKDAEQLARDTAQQLERERKEAMERVASLETSLVALADAQKVAEEDNKAEESRALQADLNRISAENERLTAKLRGVQNELKRVQIRNGGVDTNHHPAFQKPSSPRRRAKVASTAVERPSAPGMDWEAEAAKLQELLEQLTVENIELKKGLNEASLKVKDAENVGGFFAF